jgi:sec-independent protein translocase protein TatC
MSQDYDDRPDPDDLFAHTRMSLGDHIEELRTCLIRAGKGFLIALVVGFFVARYVLDFIQAPIQTQLVKFDEERFKEQLKSYKERIEKLKKEMANNPQAFSEPEVISAEVDGYVLARALGAKLPESQWITLPIKIRPESLTGPFAELQKELAPPRHLISLTITEPFIVWCKVSVYVGLVLASPWIFYQLWSFVAAGLYPHEKRYVWVFMPFCLGLFLGGVLFCQFVVLPQGIKYLLYFTKWLNIEPELRLNDWLSFAILMPIIMGIAFQLPLLMFGLYKVGVFEVEAYTGNWRMALFLMTFCGFFIAPSPDPFSGLCMALPLWLLYFVGIWLCKMWPNPKFEMEESDEEMVEV